MNEYNTIDSLGEWIRFTLKKLLIPWYLGIQWLNYGGLERCNKIRRHTVTTTFKDKPEKNCFFLTSQIFPLNQTPHIN